MLRIQMSLAVIVTLMVTVASVRTFAQYTDEDSNGGQVNPGNSKIEITGEGWVPPDEIECQELIPSDICSQDVTLEHLPGSIQVFGEIKDEYGRLEQLLNGVRE